MIGRDRDPLATLDDAMSNAYVGSEFHCGLTLLSNIFIGVSLTLISFPSSSIPHSDTK